MSGMYPPKVAVDVDSKGNCWKGCTFCSTVVVRVEPEDNSLSVMYLSTEQSVSILKITSEQDVCCTYLSTVAVNFHYKNVIVVQVVLYCTFLRCCNCRFLR